jgi:hypothetical protein
MIITHTVVYYQDIAIFCNRRLGLLIDIQNASMVYMVCTCFAAVISQQSVSGRQGANGID